MAGESEAAAGSPTTTTTTTTAPPKRHRRPSVRLGDIGDQPIIPSSKPWRHHSHHGNSPKSSKTLPLTNLNDYSSAPETTNAKLSSRRPTKKHRQNGNDNHRESESDSDHDNHHPNLDDSVRKWLVELGLGRYAPVFEIHEVDDEVLPYLTLEDLKDMGVNAVGSRRKLYAAILKLRKPAFS